MGSLETTSEEPWFDKFTTNGKDLEIATVESITRQTGIVVVLDHCK